MNWVTLCLGVLLALAPFFSGYSSQPGLLWFSLIGGVVIAVLGYKSSYKWAAIIGFVVFVAPWLFGFTGTAAATWSWIIGAVTAVLAGIKASEKKET